MLNQKNLTSTQQFFLVAFIILIGVFLRVYKSGTLGLIGNEDYVANAVQGILKTGLPLYPSGAYYPRSLPFTYLVSLAVSTFGFSESIIRLPSIIFSILTILVGYLLAARLFGIRVALIAALLLTFSDWEIMMGKTARMYGMFSFFLLLSIWLLDKAYLERGRVLKVVTLITILITCFTQRLAIILIPIILFYYFYRRPEGKSVYFLIISVFVVFLGFYINTSVVSHFYSQAIKEEKALIKSFEYAPAINNSKSIAEEKVKQFKGLWEKITESTLVESFTEKHLGLLIGGLKSNPKIILIFMLSYLIFMRTYWPWGNINSKSYLLYFISVFSLVVLQQLMLVLLLSLFYLLYSRLLGIPINRQQLSKILGIILIGAVFWLLIGFYILKGSYLENFYASVSFLLGFPLGFARFFIIPYTFLFLLALISLSIAIKRYLDYGQIDSVGFIALIFFGIVFFILGFHPYAIYRDKPRYIAFLNPYFLILAAIAIDYLIRIIFESKFKKLDNIGKVLILPVVLLFLLLVIRETIYPTYYLINTKYGNNPTPDLTLGRFHSFYPDNKTPALFVKENLASSDIVIAMDALAYYVYSSKIDYQLRVAGGNDAERWLGKNTIFTDDTLQLVINQNRTKNIWIVLDGEMMNKYKDNSEWDSIFNLVKVMAGDPVYVGLDKLSSVYLIKSF